MTGKLFFGLIFLTIYACQNAPATDDSKPIDIIEKAASDSVNYTSIHWIDSVKNIGSVNVGSKQQITFSFTNTGSKPLYIISAFPGCGCTVADYPKHAIAPGKTGEIQAEYSAPEDGEGDFRKSISVVTNTTGVQNHNLFFYGKITGIINKTKANE